MWGDGWTMGVAVTPQEWCGRTMRNTMSTRTDPELGTHPSSGATHPPPHQDAHRCNDSQQRVGGNDQLLRRQDVGGHGLRGTDHKLHRGQRQEQGDDEAWRAREVTGGVGEGGGAA